MVKKLLTLAVLSTLPYVACAQSNADTAAPNPAAPGMSEHQAASVPGSTRASGTSADKVPVPDLKSSTPEEARQAAANGSGSDAEDNNAGTGISNAGNGNNSSSNEASNAVNNEENNAATSEENNASSEENNATNEENNATNEENNATNEENNNATNEERNGATGEEKNKNTSEDRHGANQPSPGAEESTQTHSGEPLESMRESVLIRGKVHAIDRNNRLLAMALPGGQVAVIRVGDNVKNFDELKVGEPATVRYTEAVALSIGKANASQQGAEGSNGQMQQPSGTEQPGVEQHRTVVGTLSDIDRANGTITVKTKDGRAVQLRAPSGSALSGVAKGDSVYVTYREAAAVSVAPGTTSQQGQTG